MCLQRLQEMKKVRISETPFVFLLDDCIREFGEEKGRKIYQEADDIFSGLEAEADYKDNDAIREHIQMKLLPPMAYYKTLLAEGYDNDTALDFVRQETQKTSNGQDGKVAVCIFNLSHVCEEVHDEELPCCRLENRMGTVRREGDTLQSSQLHILGYVQEI